MGLAERGLRRRGRKNGIKESDRLGKLGENGAESVSDSGAKRGTGSEGGKCDGSHLGGRECVSQDTELG